MNVVSFFAGCGGLDLGFEQAGFHVVWANEFEPSVHATYEKNHPNTILCKEDINNIVSKDIPNCDGFIGGPPCQPWSVAGKQQGLEDKRGLLFSKYIGLIKEKMPKFFLIENVKGILDEKFRDVFNGFITQLDEIGYDVKYRLLDAVDYEVPQNRERVFIIGFRHDLGIDYVFPFPTSSINLTLKDAIGDLEYCAIPCTEKELFHNINTYYSGGFSSYYNRGNRRRNWLKPSFTIHATGSNMPLHPSSPNMIYNGHGNLAFIEKRLAEYRRLTVHECARIQTFPDSFEIKCDNILDAYKMIGNAVPVRMAKILANSIKKSIEKATAERLFARGEIKLEDRILVGYYKGYSLKEIAEMMSLSYGVTKLRHNKALSELKEYLTVFDDRDTTIGKGFTFCGYHFDAHRFHPPLTYGRRGGPEGGPEDAEGICCARINKDGTKYYMIITYVYPIVSARAISIIPDFLKATGCKLIFF